MQIPLNPSLFIKFLSSFPFLFPLVSFVQYTEYFRSIMEKKKNFSLKQCFDLMAAQYYYNQVIASSQGIFKPEKI